MLFRNELMDNLKFFILEINRSGFRTRNVLNVLSLPRTSLDVAIDNIDKRTRIQSKIFQPSRRQLVGPAQKNPFAIILIVASKMNMQDTIISIQYKAIDSPLSGSFKGLSIANVILEITIIIVMIDSKSLDFTIRPRNSLKRF